MNCATCKHWGAQLDDARAESVEWDETASPELRGHAARAAADPLRKCAAAPFYYDDTALSAVVCVTDGSGYRGALWTRSAFGCVLHVVKEAS